MKDVSVHEFETITERDGLVLGELADGDGVVSVPDESWTDTAESGIEGNWEAITAAVVRDVLSDETPTELDRLVVDRQRLCQILLDSDIVSHDEQVEAEYKASLLTEYLVREGVYTESSSEVAVLEELDEDADKYVKLNWTAFLSETVKKLARVVERAEEQESEIAEMYEEASDSGTTDESLSDSVRSRTELLEDLDRITAEQQEPVGSTEDGEVIPPEGVAEGDKWEYRSIVDQLMAEEKTNLDAPGGIEDPIKRVRKQIQVSNKYAQEISNLEREVREIAIPELSKLDDIQGQLQQVTRLGSDLFVGSPVNEEGVEEIGQTIASIAEEEEYEFGETEEAETETDEEQVLDEDLAERVEQSSETASLAVDDEEPDV